MPRLVCASVEQGGLHQKEVLLPKTPLFGFRLYPTATGFCMPRGNASISSCVRDSTGDPSDRMESRRCL